MNPVSQAWKHRGLLGQLTKRDLLTRYRGSLLGVLWSLLTPLFMLVVYTFVFGVIFKSRWGLAEQGQAEFALILFCGLTTFNIFAETLTRAPTIIVNNPNYVKKVVFPVEILPMTVVGAALVNGLIGIGIVLLGGLFLFGALPWTVIFMPLVLLPLLLMALGFGWFLSSMGIFVRDVGQIVPIAVAALMFLSPIFYPIASVPERFRILCYLNPISYVVEDARQVLIWGNLPNWNWLAFGTTLGAIFALLGFAWFQKTRKGFADVI